MCPSYMATLEEEHSTRGRANALRNVLSGTLPHDHFKDKRLYEVLDLCLECKACKAECPVQRGYGKAEVRIPRPLLQGTRFAIAESLIWEYRRAQRDWFCVCADVELVYEQWHLQMGNGKVYRNRFDAGRCLTLSAKHLRSGFRNIRIPTPIVGTRQRSKWFFFTTPS